MALERLNALLRDRVATMPFPPDPFHGLVLTPEDAEALATGPSTSLSVLSLTSAGPRLAEDGLVPSSRVPPLEQLPDGDPLANLRDALALDPIDLDVFILAIAPELDRRYERLFGYLQDDLTMRRPTVGFVLELLADTMGARLALLHHVAEASPLIERGLIRLAPHHPEATLTGHLLVPDRSLLRWILGVGSMPSTAAPTANGLGRLRHGLLTDVSWHDLVLPPTQTQALRELCLRVRHSTTVFDDWGFGRALLGRGTIGLFSGPPGTGKTLAARVIAAELGRPLQRIDLGQVVDKFIGETEKNLDRIFEAAQGSEAVLLFDEADALFGRRTEVRDAHDRYANHEVAHLLSRVEEHDGLALLTTNLVDNIDPAFLRRVSAVVQFPFPDVEARRQIWRRTWPDSAPLAAGVDLDGQAEFRLSGAGVRDAALTAAFLAASEGTAVTQGHLATAVQRELLKAGRLPTDGG